MGLAWHGAVRCGMAWSGTVGPGKAWCCLAGFGMELRMQPVGQSLLLRVRLHYEVRSGAERSAWARQGTVWPG